MKFNFKSGFIKTLNDLYVKVSYIETVSVVPVAGDLYLAIYKGGLHLIERYESQEKANKALEEFLKILGEM